MLKEMKDDLDDVTFFSLVNPSAALAAKIKDDICTLMDRKPREMENERLFADEMKKKLDGSSSGESATYVKKNQDRLKPSIRKSRKKAGRPSFSPNGKDLVYMKRLSYQDWYYGRLTIPVENAEAFFPGLRSDQGDGRLFLPILDLKGRLWKMKVSFSPNRYGLPLLIDWTKFMREHDLEPEDVIFIYHDPATGHYWIEYEK